MPPDPADRQRRADGGACRPGSDPDDKEAPPSPAAVIRPGSHAPDARHVHPSRTGRPATMRRSLAGHRHYRVPPAHRHGADHEDRSRRRQKGLPPERRHSPGRAPDARSVRRWDRCERRRRSRGSASRCPSPARHSIAASAHSDRSGRATRSPRTGWLRPDGFSESSAILSGHEKTRLKGRVCSDRFPRSAGHPGKTRADQPWRALKRRLVLLIT